MRYAKILLALGLGVAATFTDVNIAQNGSPLPLSFSFATPAGAVIGRPLTPLSYAGVARRTTRRAVAGTAAGITVLPPGCVYGAYYGAYYYRCGSGYYARQGNVYVRVVVQ